MALIVYESMFGDNRQVALAIAGGLEKHGISAAAVEVGVAPTEVSAEVDLLVVGSPNHAFGMPREATRADAATKTEEPLVSRGIGVREWLQLATVPSGIHTAAYDTRGSHPKAVVRFDHASSSIEKGLARLGGTRVAPAEHFLVVDITGPLEPGEVERARAWGETLATSMAASVR